MDNKRWLLVENKGEIDVNALILMGGSTKRGSESAIGYFGSGNKYSLALLIKREICFKIYSGLQELVVATKPVKFRDKAFDQILINGQDTSLTTDMGPQWDSWMAVREFVSNSIDEGEHNIVSCTEDINAKEGYTRIYVEHCPQIVEVIQNWDKYFAFDRIDTLVEIADTGKVFPNNTDKHSLLLYRKGIQCYWQEKTRTLFSYDLSKFVINESRVISDVYDSKRAVCTFLVNYATTEVAKKILKHAFVEESGEYWEGGMYWNYYGNHKLNSCWREAIGDHVIVNNDVSGNYMDIVNAHKNYRVSKEMARVIKNSFPDVPVYGIGEDDEEDSWRECEVTPKIEYMLKRTTEFCTECHYPIKYDIQVVKFDKPETLGKAANKKILLSDRLFDMGMKELVMTVMEEQEHIVTGHCDETRAFQDHLFRQWLSEKELRFGVFL